MLKNRKNKKKKGFTLIELVIVLAVMAIIALIAIPNFTAIRNNSKDKADASSLDVVERNILMLVSDGTVAAADKTIKITFDANTGLATAALNSGTIDTTEKAKIEEALKDTKKPQGRVQGVKDRTTGKRQVGTDVATGIQINITAAGDVTAQTIK